MATVMSPIVAINSYDLLYKNLPTNNNLLEEMLLIVATSWGWIISLSDEWEIC